ncbi:uncharacterized protein LOC129218347 [Uloborus diversus]|uniref:uncharacterized protein LOC129218347 n=1 Tax=Uloborus diversus TaxID=327109 RepID=UPI00240A5E90|nr:uncharacterized protein LOC129218347 [Uloborus diversus]
MQCVILSSWDFIMGPQIEKLWVQASDKNINFSKVPDDILSDYNTSKHFKCVGDSNSAFYKFDMKTFCMMCGQLLLGEVDLYKTYQGNASRFYLTGNKILVSVFFQMKSWLHSENLKKTEDASLCFGAIFKHEVLQFVLNKHSVIDNYLRKMSFLMQNCQQSMDFPVEQISAMVNELSLVLDSLAHYSISKMKVPSQEVWLVSSNIKAVVSHLQTSGHTAIVGDSEYKINELICALSMFCSHNECLNSISVTQKTLKSGINGIYIQGTIKKAPDECEILLENAVKDSLPLTVVDTDMSKVWQTLPYHNNFEKKKNFGMIEEIGSFVPQVLNDLKFVPENRIQMFFEKFCKSLAMKAVSIIKLIESCR